jgi:hypothetical protein
MKLQDMLPHFAIHPGGDFQNNPSSHVFYNKLSLLPKYWYRGIFYFGDGISGGLIYNDRRIGYRSRIYPRKRDLAFSVWQNGWMRDSRLVGWEDINAAIESTGWAVDKPHCTNDYHHYKLKWKPQSIIATVEGQAGDAILPVDAAKMLGVSGSAIVRAANSGAMIKGIKFNFKK